MPVLQASRSHLAVAVCVASLVIGVGPGTAAQAGPPEAPALRPWGSGWSTLVADTVKEAVSREISTLADAGAGPTDAWSREISVLSDAPIAAASQATSREMSVLADPGGRIDNATSREVSALVDPPVLAPPNAASREVSLLTDTADPGVRDLASREWSVAVDTSLSLARNASSREISALVDVVAGTPPDALTREVAVLAAPRPLSVDASTREVAVLVDPGIAALPDAVTREVAALVDVLSLYAPDGVSRELTVLTGASAIVDASSREVSVLPDKPTSTLLTMMTVTASPAGIELRWRFDPSLAVQGCVLERASAADGAFQETGVTRSEESDGFAALDSSVVEGQTYWYRLIVHTLDGRSLTLGPMSATASAPIAELSLAPIAPNPTRGAVRVGFSLSRETEVRISVLDLQGREIAILVDQRYRAGRYSGTWALTSRQGAAKAGVYFVRLRAEGKALTRRLVVAR